VQDRNVIVLYATAESVAALGGERGYSRLALRLDDPSPAAAARTVEAVRERLRTVAGYRGLTDLPQVRAPGEWPGKAETEKFGQLLGVITLLALLSALVLVSNTMTTLVAEQTREVAIMRALGGRPRQVALVYVRTALLLGGTAALAGVLLGVALSNALAGYFGTMFWAVDVPVGVDVPVALLSLLVGLLAPPLTALPAIRRATRVDLRDALEASGSALGGEDAADRLLRRLRFLPRSAQIGLRNAGRRRRRSLATVFVVALAVANLLAVLGVAASASETSRASWATHLEDIQISTAGQALFDERAERAIAATPGVAEAQPVLKNTVEIGGREAFVWGVAHEPLLRHRSAGGRWFTADEARARAPVAVIERNLAEIAGIAVGNTVPLATAAGRVEVRIVGLARNQQEDGTVLYVPLATARRLLDRPAGVSTYWIRTTSPDEALVDRTAARLEDRLAALGYETATEIAYVAERDEIAANRSITTSIAVLGFLIVAMSMVGLANAITTSVLERTREIGILRSIGARARHVRRIFAAEGLALALAGWLAGVPLGYLLERALIRFIWEVVEVRMPLVFPPWNVPLALAGTVALALLITALPIRRAVRYRPDDALRYAA
jgi:putative ABC transport system permease protein